MKRYWLFAFESYYPMGGMRDFRASFDTVQECINAFPRCRYHPEQGHVWDSVENKVVHDFYEPENIEEFNNDIMDFKYNLSND